MCVCVPLCVCSDSVRTSGIILIRVIQTQTWWRITSHCSTVSGLVLELSWDRVSLVLMMTHSSNPSSVSNIISYSPQDLSSCLKLCPRGLWEESGGFSPSSLFHLTLPIWRHSWQWSGWSRPSILPTIWPNRPRFCMAWWRMAPPWLSLRYCGRSKDHTNKITAAIRHSLSLSPAENKDLHVR